MPADERVLVTNHEVFGYFADRYGFEVVGAVIPSMTTRRRAVGRRRRRRWPTSIAEPRACRRSSPRRPPPPTWPSPGRRRWATSRSSTLFTESLGEPGSGAETYLDMMRTDAELIAEAARPRDRLVHRRLRLRAHPAGARRRPARRRHDVADRHVGGGPRACRSWATPSPTACSPASPSPSCGASTSRSAPWSAPPSWSPGSTSCTAARASPRTPASACSSSGCSPSASSSSAGRTPTPATSPSFLFGDILGVRPRRSASAGGLIAAVTLVAVAVLYRPVPGALVQPRQGPLLGQRPGLAHAAMLVLLALAVVGVVPRRRHAARVRAARRPAGGGHAARADGAGDHGDRRGARLPGGRGRPGHQLPRRHRRRPPRWPASPSPSSSSPSPPASWSPSAIAAPPPGALTRSNRLPVHDDRSPLRPARPRGPRLRRDARLLPEARSTRRRR